MVKQKAEPEGKTVAFRANRQDLAVMAKLKKITGVKADGEILRMAIRQMLAGLK